MIDIDIDIVIVFLIYIIVALSFLLSKIHRLENYGGYLTNDDCINCALWPLYTIVVIAACIIEMLNKEEV